MVRESGCHEANVPWLGAGSWVGSRRLASDHTAHRRAYESIDMAPRGHDAPTWIGDISEMTEVGTNRYDTLVCHQVLEHVRRPWNAVREFHRVLKPGASLIVSVPHLSRRHELPRDYLRFTQEWLRTLLEDAGFADVEVKHFGGVLTFLHHQFSFILPGLLMGIPLIGGLAVVMNAPTSWAIANIDGISGRQGLIPPGILATARKP